MTKNQQDAKQAHRLNMINSLEHRISVARAKGDQELIEKLEAEKRQYNN